MAVISSLHVYPVKALHGVSLESATLTARGLQFDRNWMVVDGAGVFVTQRCLPMMATIRVKVDDQFLVLEHASAQPLYVELHSKLNARVTARVWHDTCEGYDEGPDASSWLTQVLGRFNGDQLRLVRFATDFFRPVDPDYMNGDSAHTAFADGYPFLVTSEASLGALNSRLLAKGAAGVPMSRFRPNIVLSGVEAFEEDRTKRLLSKSAAYELVLRKPCRRCKVVTVDQEHGLVDNPKEPLATLTMMNTYPDLSGAYFGQNATLSVGDGTSMSVGDELELL